MNRELLQQALDKFEQLWEIGIDAEYKVDLMPEIRALRAELAKPEQELQMIQIKDGQLSYIKKPWVGLTDDEINDFDKKLRDNGDYCSLHFAWGISAKLKEKNNAI